MDKGVYCLILKNKSPARIKIGALGDIDFKMGYYIYVGSALGTGGLDRVCRHIRFYKERYRKPKWHIDYLMEKTDLIEAVYAKTKERLECALAQTIGGECIAGFGCSDCKCSSHLFCRDENPRDEITQSFEALSLTPVTYKVF